MAVRPMLDDLELPQVQELATYDRRALAEHHPPGGDGSQLQDMGRRPTTVALWGVVTGPEATAFVERLAEKFRAGTPVPFVADITADTGVDQVLIDDLTFQELGGLTERTAFVLRLRQFLAPTEPAQRALLDPDITADAASLMDLLVDGLALGEAFTTGLERFVGVLTPLLDRLSSLNR
jgi:hypothetical protein